MNKNGSNPEEYDECGGRADGGPPYSRGGRGYIAGFFSGMAICAVAALIVFGFYKYGGQAARGLLGGSGASRSSGLSGGSRNSAKNTAVSDEWSEIPDGVLSKINEIYKVLDKHYVDDYEKGDTLDALYSGLVYGVGDPYTVYMNPRQFDSFMQDTNGSFAGLGIVVSVDEKDNRIVVVSPFEGCPAIKAGIMSKDKIIKVNGYPVSGDNLDEAVSMMKGEPGTSVTVTVYRESERAEKDFTLTRENIEVPTVSHKMLDDDIGYIRITQFARVTDTQFFAAKDELFDAGMKALVVDLRGNPGGLLDVVCNITDTLVPEGTIVYTEDKNGKRVTTPSDKNTLGLPLILLVNGGSASASEVLSGAVKDLGAGELLGTQTFGKGLVQNIFTLSDGSAIKITIAKYYTPSGVCIQGEGITPDYIVEMDDELSNMIGSLTLEEDVQLSKAIEILTGKVASGGY